MSRCIAFHSYKGGTGKTTIAANLAAALAAKGNNVALVDLDVYAPSLHSYFDIIPNKWLNDLLSQQCDLPQVMVDATDQLSVFLQDSKIKPGKLWLGLSNPDKEAVYELEKRVGGAERNAKIQVLRRFIEFRDKLISDYDCDFIILDTSPGIRYWSINALAIADMLILTLKFGELDIAGTKKIAADIYGSLEKLGSKSYLLLNRVSGYCTPPRLVRPKSQSELDSGAQIIVNPDHQDFAEELSKQVSMELLSAIPCYCDIQFSRKEFLTALEYRSHPFSLQIERLASEYMQDKA